MEKETRKVKKKEIHSGHRARLTELVNNAGIENVSEVQAVEFFLTYIIPRCDVNPLAHKLLDVYGNFANVVDADVNDLMQIKGISRQTAMKIKLFGELMDLYVHSKSCERVSLKNNKEFLDYIENLMKYKSTENLYLFAIDHGLKLIQSRKLDLKRVRMVGIEPIEILNFINSTHPAYLAVAHNHPGGTAMASQEDHEASEYLDNLLINFECQFLDSFIVGCDGIYSERQDGFVRFYNNISNYKTN